MHNMAVLKFNFKLSVWQGIDNRTFHFYMIFFRHVVGCSLTFCFNYTNLINPKGFTLASQIGLPLSGAMMPHVFG